MVRALVFDFDGLIVETELPLFQAWQRIYFDHGLELAEAEWATLLGGDAEATFDPTAELRSRSGATTTDRELQLAVAAYYEQLTTEQRLSDGVQSYLDDARQLGLGVAIASSSSRDWIERHLLRLGVNGAWSAVVCREDVQRVKPDPELYALACRYLGTEPGDALALEDSSNGVRAAKAAGLLCAAVPTRMTGGQDFSQADLILPSLREVPLRALLERLEWPARTAGADRRRL